MASELQIKYLKKLINDIIELPTQCLEQVLKIIKNEEPHNLLCSKAEWNFDLSKLLPSTLRNLQNLAELHSKGASPKDLHPSSAPAKQETVKRSGPALRQRTRRKHDSESLNSGGGSHVGATSVNGRAPSAPAEKQNASKRCGPTLSKRTRRQSERESLKRKCKSPSDSATFPDDTHAASAPTELRVSDRADRADPTVVHKRPRRRSQRVSLEKPKACRAPPQNKTRRQSKGTDTDGTKVEYRIVKSGDKDLPLQCSFCRRKFRGRTEVKMHLRTHTGEKPLVCKFPGCDTRFAHNSNLRTHERSHNKSSQFACTFPDCDKRFRHRASLKAHMCLHTGERPHKCVWPGCTSDFPDRSNLNRHRKLHEKNANKTKKRKGI